MSTEIENMKKLVTISAACAALFLLAMSPVSWAEKSTDQPQKAADRSIKQLIKQLGKEGDYYKTSEQYESWKRRVFDRRADRKYRWSLHGAEKELADRGDKALGELTRVLGTMGEKTRKRSGLERASLSPPFAKGSSMSARMRAAVVMVHIGGAGARKALIKALHSVETPWLGAWILKALGRLGDKKALPVVNRFMSMDHPSIYVQQSAAYAALKLGSKRGIKTLKFLAKDPRMNYEPVDLLVEGGGLPQIGDLIEILENTPKWHPAKGYIKVNLVMLMVKWRRHPKSTEYEKRSLFSRRGRASNYFKQTIFTLPSRKYREWWERHKEDILRVAGDATKDAEKDESGEK